jgi:hypothetical protein
MNRFLIATLLASVAFAPAYAGKDKDKDAILDRLEDRAFDRYEDKIERLEGRLEGAGDDERQRIENIIESVTEKYEAKWGELPEEPPPPPPPPPPEPEPASINSTNFHACIGLTTCTIGRATITANNGKLDVANSDSYEGLGVKGVEGTALIDGAGVEFVKINFASPTMITEITVNHLFGYSNTLEFKSDGNRNGPVDANGTTSAINTSNYAEVGALSVFTGFSLNAKATLLDAHAGLWQITDPWDAPVNYIELHPATNASYGGGVSLASFSFETSEPFVGY